MTFYIQRQIIFFPFHLSQLGNTLSYSMRLFCVVTFPANQKLIYVTLIQKVQPDGKEGSMRGFWFCFFSKSMFVNFSHD